MGCVNMGSGAGTPPGAMGEATAGIGPGASAGGDVMGAGAGLLRGTSGGLTAGPGAGTSTGVIITGDGLGVFASGIIMGEGPGVSAGGTMSVAGIGASAGVVDTGSVAAAIDGPAADIVKHFGCLPLHQSGTFAISSLNGCMQQSNVQFPQACSW